MNFRIVHQCQLITGHIRKKLPVVNNSIAVFLILIVRGCKFYRPLFLQIFRAGNQGDQKKSKL